MFKGLIIAIFALSCAQAFADNTEDEKAWRWPKRMWKCSITTLPPVLRNCVNVHYPTSIDKYGKLHARAASRDLAEQRVKNICDSCEAEYEGTNYQCEEIMSDESNYRCAKSWRRIGWDF